MELAKTRKIKREIMSVKVCVCVCVGESERKKRSREWKNIFCKRHKLSLVTATGGGGGPASYN